MREWSGLFCFMGGLFEVVDGIVCCVVGCCGGLFYIGVFALV